MANYSTKCYNEVDDSNMRIFKTKWFDKWAIKEGVTNATLISAMDEIARGLVDAELGGHVYKKRIKLPGRGKRGGARTLLTYKANDKAFFIYGYAKNERENIGNTDLEALKELAVDLLGYTEAEITKAIENAEFKEIKGDEEK
jgi:hypothetical protein